MHDCGLHGRITCLRLPAYARAASGRVVATTVGPDYRLCTATNAWLLPTQPLPTHDRRWIQPLPVCDRLWMRPLLHAAAANRLWQTRAWPSLDAIAAYAWLPARPAQHMAWAIDNVATAADLCAHAA
ncbi:hypothetical protein BHM03_00060237 [Ensete ventricosum]|nr:hypothetical protein BHM03_00060237 [Ensete ventricosum]